MTTSARGVAASPTCWPKPSSRVPSTLPYGSWPTPITSELVVRSARLPNGVRVDGDDVWWSEGRPEEGGRIAVLRRRPDGSVDEVLPGAHSARTAVHEY